jgi:FkbM family methyltransferase
VEALEGYGPPGAEYLSYLYRYYLTVGTFSLADRLRLWLAPLLYLAKGKRSMSIGLHIPGTRPLVVRSWDGYFFVVRPGTEDLGLALLLLDHYKVRRWIQPRLGSVFVDVGAGVGGYTVRACNYSKVVVAIEPNPESRALLRVNTALNCERGNVVIVGKAVGDRPGAAWLEVPVIQGGKATGRGRLKTSGARGINAVHYRVEVDTLDGILGGLGIRGADLMKIDIEGSEALAVAGMEETLRSTRALMIEVRPGNEWVLARIMRLGFRLVDRRDHDYLLVRPVSRV